MRSDITVPVLILLISSGCSSPPQIRPNEPPAVSQSAPPASLPEKGKKRPKHEGDKEIRCTLGKDERIIMLEPNNPGCEIYYNKPGEPDPKVVAVSKKHMKFCEDIFERMRANLTTAGFTCK